MSGLYFSCPVCGDDVPRQAKSCPSCGACEKSGWSEESYLDGIDLPEEDEAPGPYLNSKRRSKPASKGLPTIWMIVAAVLLGAMLLSIIRAVW